MGNVNTPYKVFTVLVRDKRNTGTTHIGTYWARDIAEAKLCALNAVSASWDYIYLDLHVLGVFAGDVSPLEWEDL
jgi:hypothetical protein